MSLCSYQPLLLPHSSARLLSRDITSENARLHPVNNDQDTVACWYLLALIINLDSIALTAETHAQVCTPPEKIGQSTTSGKVTSKPAEISNGLFASNVSQRSLMRVLKWTHLLDPSQASLQFFDLVESIVASLWSLGGTLNLGQIEQLLLDLGGLCHLSLIHI